ncbi:unnamed protein product [Echinostoma caproni]|uniref:Conserved oligomeric Golgi complex subunit 7 n=1 Tax=Echinostoma caproni TaxID=27848 RepID=A0A3P8GS81_9TREM|nr:unnamed protein product [Echinostoma caproni]
MWDQSTVTNQPEGLRNLPVTLLQTVGQLITAATARMSVFGQSLSGSSVHHEEKCRMFALFIAQLIHLCENQIAQKGYSIMMMNFNSCEKQSSSSTSDTTSPPTMDSRSTRDYLTRVLVSPFKQMTSIFTSQCNIRFSEQLDGIKLTWENPTDVSDSLSTALIESIGLVTEASKFCLEETHAICLPLLLDLIQTYWEGLITKWLAAIEQLGKQLVIPENNAAYNQASFFASALQLASELSSRADMLVENLLLQSAETLSGLLQTRPAASPPSDDTATFVQQLALIQSDKCLQALRCLAYSGHDTARSGPDPSGSHTHSSLCRLTAVHRANVRMCRTAVTMVRRVALAPVRRLLDQVPQLSIWSAVPSSGECTLPNLAYLPQDYMTQIGQYLLALPESFEPYMGTNGPPTDSNGLTLDPHEDLLTSRGLAECLRLGDSESVAVSLSSRLPEQTDPDQGGRGSTQRKRYTSLGQMSGARESAENPHSDAALCWLETLISGVACDMLVGAVLKIGSRTSESGRSDVDDSEDVALLTEHGAKQLQVDLDYFRNLLDDLGLPLTGSLKALCELIQCPVDEFANLSASRPPRIVNTVAKLRGI